MKCPLCSFNNPAEAEFCIECGKKIEFCCPDCGAATPAKGKFCMKCGHPLKDSQKLPTIDYSKPHSYTPKHLADKILTNRSSLEGERKIVTVLFADVANYTAMSEKLDPEEVLQIMDGAFKIMMDETHKYEGTINQFTGDGIMAIFGAPVAHENHAQRACYTALSIQTAMTDYSARIEKRYGIDFKIRIGINSGAVIVSAIGDDLRMDYTAVGDTTNLSARIQQASKQGQVWVSLETRNIIQDYFHLEPVGEISLKGKAQPQTIYRVVSERTGVRTRFDAGLVRGITDLVGRRPEMEILKSAFEKAKTGDGQVMDVVGEAGVGKSRLVYEFKKAVDKDAIFITGLCIHHGRNISFLPVADILRNAFKIEVGMTEKEATDLIERITGNKLAQMVPFYQSLLSLKVDDPKFNALNPEGRKFGTFEAVKDLLLEISREHALIIFLDDVQWMDKISEEFFTYLSRCIPGHPVLMIAAYRPEGSPAWAQGTHYQRIGLEPLSSKSSVKLVRNILGGVALDPQLEQKIVEKTEGNPLFVEEIVRELLERGDLIKTGDQFTCTIPLDQCDIPNTIHGVLAARMDRLSEDLKRTMQVASVIGKDFAFQLLKSIMDLGEELRVHLSNLVGLEILYEKALYPELEYIFKHALTQEVAYDSLLKERRRAIHGRIAQTIEDLYADQIEKHYEILAHHFERAGNAEKAIHYLMLAGEKSNHNSAFQSAYEFFSKVFELAENKGIKLTPETQALAYHGKGRASQDMDDIDTALAQLNMGLEISRRHGLVEFEMNHLRDLATAMHFTPVEAMKKEVARFFDDGISRAREVGSKMVESWIMTLKGMYIHMVGRRYPGPERYKGNEILIEAERLAMEEKDIGAITFNSLFRAISERWLGRPKKAIELTDGAEEGLRSLWNLKIYISWIPYKGIALAEVGRIDDGIEILNYGIDMGEKFGESLGLAKLYNTLGYCFQEIHHADRAWILNVKSREIAYAVAEKSPMGRQMASEVAAQAEVNLMENLYDQGKVEEAWKKLEYFSKVSENDDYDRARDQRESRMNYLFAQILLYRGQINEAEPFIKENLESVIKQHAKKREGCFLRLLAEVQMKRDQSEEALANFNKAIQILKDVGNPRQLWQANASLGSAFDKLGRFSEAKHQWGAASEVIHKTANGLSDKELREGFLNAGPIKNILAKAER